jgi:hypothetical protein
MECYSHAWSLKGRRQVGTATSARGGEVIPWKCVYCCTFHVPPTFISPKKGESNKNLSSHHPWIPGWSIGVDSEEIVTALVQKVCCLFRCIHQCSSYFMVMRYTLTTLIWLMFWQTRAYWLCTCSCRAPPPPTNCRLLMWLLWSRCISIVKMKRGNGYEVILDELSLSSGLYLCLA